MKTTGGDEPTAMAIDEKQNDTPTLTSSSSPKPEDEREDWSADAREMNEERESSSTTTANTNNNNNNNNNHHNTTRGSSSGGAPEVQQQSRQEEVKKQPTKPSPSRKKATQQRRYPPTADGSVYPYQPPYPPGSRPYPPPPPPYGYGGGGHDYRGPPPHPHHYHPHHLPPPHHPHQYNPYGPPPPGRHQSYHHPHHPYATSAPYPMMYHPGPPPPPPPPPHGSSSSSAAIHPYPPPNGSMPPGIATSDSGSVASSSKTTATNKKYNSKSAASRKKRTIDGIAQETKDLAAAFSFRRTNSNTSNSSVTTLGNNTSNDNNTHQSDESTQPTAKLPSTMLSNSPSSHHNHHLHHHHHMNSSHNIFDDHHNDHHPQHNMLRGGDSGGARHHRRTFSGASTASTLSVGGFSLGSYDGQRIKATDSMMADETPLTKSSPKRRKGSDLSSTPLMMIDTDSGRPPSWSSRHHRSILSQSSFQSLGDVATDSSARFEQLSMDDHHDIKASSTKQHDSTATSSSSGNLFLTLSTSPINAAAADVEATPISKNTRKSLMITTGSVTKVEPKGRGIASLKMGKHKSDGVSPIKIDVGADTPSPPISKAPSTERDTMTEEHMLNRHLRGQSFTPLPHLSTGGAESAGTSPTNTAFSTIAPQLSWSITGDTPSLGDLADWEEDRQQAQKLESKRPSSTTSQSSAGTRGTNMVISPHSFTMWREEHESTSGRSTTGATAVGGSSHHHHKSENASNRGDVVVGGGESSVRFLRLSPNSDIAGDEALSGTTTPLPVFFDHPSAEERDENMRRHQLSPSAKVSSMNHGNARHHHHHQQQHQQQLQNHHHQQQQHQHQHHQHHNGMQHPGDHDHSSNNNNNMAGHWGHKGGNNNSNKGPWQHMDHNSHAPPMIGSLPPTPVYAAMEFHDEFIRSPHHSGERRDGPPDFFPSGGNAYAHAAHNDRIRNLRGRLPPGSHLPPMPLHIPQQVTSHPLTSPMGLGPPTPHGKPMWSPHGMPPPMGSPHHMSPMDMSQSKRKCVPLKPPIPSKFQGDMEKLKSAQVPEFTSLVNFPAHMSQKQSVNLPDGMRCCVMCGQACPCSTGTKTKKSSSSVKSSDSSLAPRNSNGQDMLDGKSSGYAIIPTQNKGLCTLCDVNVWVVVTTGLEIKWCKGCKNFRPWAAFGDKGLATKCLRCRERQREKYALQKEEKEKARMVSKSSKTKM